MIKIKRGDTFKLTNVVTNEGTALDISTGWSIRSQIRKDDVLIDELVPLITDGVNGVYTLTESSTGVTESWEVGFYECDIEYTVSGEVLSTETFMIEVVKDITLPVVLP